MLNFREIEYDTGMKLFERADRLGQRLKLGEFETSQWLQRNNLKLSEIVGFAKELPDSKIFIIGQGSEQGFYIYSQKQKTCYKFEPAIAAM